MTLLASFFATPFVIRLLGPEAYGLLALITVLIGYLSFTDMGMGVAATKFGSAAHARGDDNGEVAVVWTSLLISCIPVFSVAAVLNLLATPLIEQILRLPPSLHSAATLALRLASLGFLARSLAGVFNSPQLSHLRLDLFTILTYGSATLQVCLVPIVLLLGGGLVSAVGVAACIGVGTLLLHMMVSRRMLPGLFQMRIDWSLIKPMTRFGGAFLLHSFSLAILMNAEKLVLARFVSLTALAYYSVAYTVANLLTILPLALSQALLPAFSRLQAVSDREGLRQLYTGALRASLISIVPIATLICFIAKPFFSVWAGPEYGRQCPPLLYIFVGGLVFNVAASIPYGLLVASGKTHLVALFLLSELLPYLLCSVVLTYQYGASGAALAWTIRVTLDAVLLFLAAWRVFGFRVSADVRNASGYGAAILALLLPLILIGGTQFSLPTLMTVTLCSVLAYGSLIWTLVLTPAERTWASTLLDHGRHEPRRTV